MRPVETGRLVFGQRRILKVYVNSAADPSYPHHIAAVVNAAFALELYLKSLSAEWVLFKDLKGESETRAFDRVPFMVHEPTKLFDKLKPHLAEHLERAYSETRIDRAPTTFREALALYDRTFQQWRYLFEDPKFGEGLDDALLLRLLDFFGRALETLPSPPADVEADNGR